jgi:hypothetical protein
MNAEKIIAEIEWLERLHELPDARPSEIAGPEEEKHKSCETCIDNPRLQLPTQEWLEHLSKLPDNRMLQITGLKVGKVKDDNVTYFNWSWFRLRKRDGN